MPSHGPRVSQERIPQLVKLSMAMTQNRLRFVALCSLHSTPAIDDVDIISFDTFFEHASV